MFEILGFIQNETQKLRHYVIASAFPFVNENKMHYYKTKKDKCQREGFSSTFKLLKYNSPDAISDFIPAIRKLPTTNSITTRHKIIQEEKCTIIEFYFTSKLKTIT